VEVHVVRLRRKLAAACSEFTYIHTRHRVGYLFEPVPDVAPVLRRRRS
jgi:DNA-binding response OmpR family regulator